MASLNKFLDDPTRQVNYHESYSNSFFSLPASPEYSMSETCLASLIRSIGSGVRENEVYSRNSQEGSTIRTTLEKRWREFQHQNRIGDNLFSFLKSPLAGQSLKNPAKYLNLYPLIPQFSYISNSPRFSDSTPWNPSTFIKGMIASGSINKENAKNTWYTIFECLSVTEEDDLWARFLMNIFNLDAIEDEVFNWEFKEFQYEEFAKFKIDDTAFNKYDFPAKTFCQKISEIIALKRMTTRKQWLTMFESFLRVSMGTHLIWVCEINKRLWQLIRDEDSEYKEYSYNDIVDNLFKDFRSFELDSKCDSVFRRICGDYAEARIGINLLIHYCLDKFNVKPNSGINNLNSLVDWINEIKPLISRKDTREELRFKILNLLGQNPSIEHGRSSFSKNMFEFLRHTLGQKATIESKDKSYDQCYWVVKKGISRNAPWIVKLGPVSILTIVAISLNAKSGTATDLTYFLSKLGIVLNPDKILNTSLGTSLVDLGLTNDNPDGEKGIIILNPFYQA